MNAEPGRGTKADVRGQELRDAILSKDVPYVRTLLRSGLYNAAWTDKGSQVGFC